MSYSAGDRATWVEDKRMDHVRGSPKDPHENHYLPGAREAAIGDLVDHDNHRHVHESLDNVTLADACFGPRYLDLREEKEDQGTAHRSARLAQSALHDVSSSRPSEILTTIIGSEVPNYLTTDRPNVKSSYETFTTGCQLMRFDRRFDREGRVTETVANGPVAIWSLTRREAIKRTVLLGVAPLVVAACLPAAEMPPPAAVAALDRGEPFADGSFFDDGFGWIA